MHRVSDANAVILLSFEDEQATSAAHWAIPWPAQDARMRNSILITGGWIVDCDGDSRDGAEFSTVAESHAALSLMLRTDTAARMAAGIPACTTPANATGLG